MDTTDVAIKESITALTGFIADNHHLVPRDEATFILACALVGAAAGIAIIAMIRLLQSQEIGMETKPTIIVIDKQ